MLSAAVCAMAFSANADVADDIVVADVIESSAFDSVYAGLGIGGSFLKSSTDITWQDLGDVSTSKLSDTKANRFIGSFVLGAGKVFNNKVYLGGEFLVDFTKNKKKEYKENDVHYADLSMKGFIPQVVVKAGYAFRKDVLAYVKLGCAWTKASIYHVQADKTYSKTKASFVLGLGGEKVFCKKFSAAIEGDYNFGWKTKFSDDIKKDSRCNKGWTVRALVKYNVKY